LRRRDEATSATKAVEARGLVKVYQGSRNRRVRALDGIDLTTGHGEFLVLLGPSGCGKTTLLRTIAGLERPTEGEVHIDGQLVNGLPPRIRRVAMVLQSYALYPHKTVRGNIEFPLKAEHVPRHLRERKVKWAADLLDIPDLLGRRPRQLSGGERQRVAIARAVVGDHRLLLADEPTGALDSVNGEAVMRLILTACKSGVGAVVVTHDAQLASWADRVVFIRDGRVVDRTAPRPGPDSLLTEEPAR
jgi:ABC-type sugar transport system ATPase subunit